MIPVDNLPRLPKHEILSPYVDTAGWLVPPHLPTSHSRQCTKDATQYPSLIGHGRLEISRFNPGRGIRPSPSTCQTRLLWETPTDLGRTNVKSSRPITRHINRVSPSALLFGGGNRSRQPQSQSELLGAHERTIEFMNWLIVSSSTLHVACQQCLSCLNGNRGPPTALPVPPNGNIGKSLAKSESLSPAIPAPARSLMPILNN